MLVLEILNKKKFITKPNGDISLDLTRGSIDQDVFADINPISVHIVTESENMKDALKAIRIALEKGLPLSKSIAMYPDIFPEYYIQNI